MSILLRKLLQHTLMNVAGEPAGGGGEGAVEDEGVVDDSPPNTDDASLNYDELMAAGLDDVEDIPDFEVPPIGSYLFEFTLARKVINDADSIEATFKVVETLQLANADDKPAVNGTQFSILYRMGNKWGVGSFKKLAKPFFAHFGFANYGEFMEAAKAPITIGANLQHRKGKKGTDREGEVYAKIRDIIVQ